MRRALIGSTRVTAWPRNTAGMLASIMPVVVQAATASTSWYLAASAAVAIWVLSPISTRKNDTTVVRKTPMRQRRGLSSSSSLSGISAHAAMAMNEAETAYLNQTAFSRLER